MYEGDEINSFDGHGTFDRPGAIVSSSPDERQNAAPQKGGGLFGASSQAQSNSSVSANIFRRPSFQGVAIDPYQIQEERAPRRISKTPFVVGGILLAIVGAVVLVITLIPHDGVKAGKDSDVAGEMNLSAIFDENAPVPFRTSRVGEYGYINVATKSWAIERQFTAADQFYGNYARAEKDGKIVIINRKGEVQADATKGDKVYYDTKNNLWIVGDDIYDGKMQKLNDEGKASYLGYGYLLIKLSNGIIQIQKIEGKKKVFECESVGCSVIVSRDLTNNEAYAMVSSKEKGARLISLSDGVEIYKASNSAAVLLKVSEGVFAEKTSMEGTVTKYISLKNGQTSTSKTMPKTKNEKYISNSGSYRLANCESYHGNKVVNNNGDTVIDCNVGAFYELSTSVYKKYEKEDMHVILYQKDNNVHVYDMKGRKDIVTYKGAVDATLTDDSVFVELIMKDEKHRMCNIFKPNIDCIEVSDANEIKPYTTFLVANGKTYSYELKEVTYEEK